MRRDRLKFAPRPFRDWRRVFGLFLIFFVVGMLLYWQWWLPALDDLEARGRARATQASGQKLDERHLLEVATIIDTRAVNFESYLNQ